MHSGKDKVECISIIGIVDGFGKFQYLSHSFAGSIPDQVSLNFLSLSNTVSLVTENEFLVGDAAFPHIRQFCDNVLIPIYPKEKKELNQAISKYRSLIERAWCQIEKWSILLKYRLVWKEYQSSEDIMKIHNETMFIITSLYNIFNKPLGESSSLPSKHGIVFHGRPNLNYHREILNIRKNETSLDWKIFNNKENFLYITEHYPQLATIFKKNPVLSVLDGDFFNFYTFDHFYIFLKHLKRNKDETKLNPILEIINEINKKQD
ncbi:hypothetical protein ACTFIY_001754 [Dictyostelium cf. discoideum]